MVRDGEQLRGTRNNSEDPTSTPGLNLQASAGSYAGWKGEKRLTTAVTVQENLTVVRKWRLTLYLVLLQELLLNIIVAMLIL